MSSLLAANKVDSAAMADELARFRIIDPTRLSELLSVFSGGGQEALAEYLIHCGVLTPFQAELVLAGDCRALALGPYRLTGLAGQGTFGPVYSATHLDKPGEFRLSIFPIRSLWRARQAKQLARSLSTILHSAVVPLVDADSSNGFHYLVWPLVVGEVLAERIASSGPLSPSEAIGMLADLAEALHGCHSRKIYHGALNPHSIGLDHQGLPHILDLGAGAILIANLDQESLLDSLSASVAAAEILKFAAPEFATVPAGSPVSDQYSLGAIGYYVLTGEPPFATASLTDWLAAKARGQPYPLAEVTSSIPAELVGIIDRMMQTNPEDRFPGLEEVRDRLGAISGCSIPLSQSSESRGSSTGTDDLPLSQSSNSSRSSGINVRPVPGSGISDLPVRDESEASITFDLPHPTPDSVPEPLPLKSRAGEKPNRAAAFDGDRAPQGDINADGAGRDLGLKKDMTSRNDCEGNFMQNEPDSPIGTSPSVHDLFQNAALSSSSPASRTSPQPEDLHMAKMHWNDPFERANKMPVPSKARASSDPRRGVSTPVHYHTETAEDAEAQAVAGQMLSQGDSGECAADSVLWKKVKRSLLFWQTPQDALQVSVFGPKSVAPGQPAKLTVFLHTPETSDSVRTLSRAFHHDSELIGSGFLAQDVARDSELGVHLSVANAGVSKSLLTLTWRGQPHRLVFDLHVPWESPGGPAPGLVSIGRNNIRIGKVEFWLTLLPRKG